MLFHNKNLLFRHICSIMTHILNASLLSFFVNTDKQEKIALSSSPIYTKTSHERYEQY